MRHIGELSDVPKKNQTLGTRLIICIVHKYRYDLTSEYRCENIPERNIDTANRNTVRIGIQWLSRRVFRSICEVAPLRREETIDAAYRGGSVAIPSRDFWAVGMYSRMADPAVVVVVSVGRAARYGEAM